MSTVEFIIGLFYRVDEVVGDVPKHAQAKLYPSEVVTLANLVNQMGLVHCSMCWCCGTGWMWMRLGSSISRLLPSISD